MSDFNFSFNPKRGNTLLYQEPVVLHCHHYNTFFQASIEDTREYLDVYPLLQNPAHEIAHEVLQAHFLATGIQDEGARKKATEKLLAQIGIGSFDLAKLTAQGGEVYAATEHFAESWRIKFGVREEGMRCVSVFATGFLAGAFEAIYGLPMGQAETRQTQCITKGEKEARFQLTLADTPKVLAPSSKAGKYQERPLSEDKLHGLSLPEVRDAVLALPLQSNADGLIEAFDVLLTRLFANYYNRVSFQFIERLEAALGQEGRVIGTELLSEAGHVCAFHTLGGILQSMEFRALLQGQTDDKEKCLVGLIGVMNALGWGMYEIEDLKPGEQLKVRVTSGYEANYYLAEYGATAQYPISFFARGVLAGAMNLLWHGEANKPEVVLDAAYYQGVFNAPGRFIGQQVACRAMGDPHDRFIVKRQ